MGERKNSGFLVTKAKESKKMESKQIMNTKKQRKSSLVTHLNQIDWNYVMMCGNYQLKKWHINQLTIGAGISRLKCACIIS